MSLFGVSDLEYHEKTIKYWSDVYGFKMSSLKRPVLQDAQVLTLDQQTIVSDLFKFKEIDCLKISKEEISKFDTEFCLKITKDTFLTGIGSSFDTFFDYKDLGFKVINHTWFKVKSR